LDQQRSDWEGQKPAGIPTPQKKEAANRGDLMPEPELFIPSYLFGVRGNAAAAQAHALP
jgi:hypothetical protein